MLQALFNGIQQQLIQDIQSATSQITVAVAWFTNPQLFNALLIKAKDGVSVSLLILNDRLNNKDNGLRFQHLADIDRVKFYFSIPEKLMHHKFCVIDNSIVFTGSYNWTYAAEHWNDENLLRAEDLQLANTYVKAFDSLTVGLKPVHNIAEYILENPVQDSMLDMSHIVLEDMLYQLEEPDLSIEDKSTIVAKLRVGNSNNVRLKALEEEYKRHQINSLEEFCVRYPKPFLYNLGKRYAWNSQLLQLYLPKLYCGSIQANEVVKWTDAMIREFYSCLHRSSSNLGSGFFSNDGVFISLNEMRYLDYRIASRYDQLKRYHPDYDDSERNRDEPFYIFKAFEGHKSIYKYLENPLLAKYEDDDYPWTMKELDANFGHLNFSFGRASKKIKWDRELLNRVKQKNPGQYYLFCSNIYLTAKQLSQFSDILNWKGIALNRRLNWSEELFERNKVHLLPHMSDLSTNTEFPWNDAFINRYEAVLNFHALSENRGMKFTEQLISTYVDRWKYKSNDYKSLSGNPSVPWTENLLERFKDKVNWIEIAGNSGVPWRLHMVSKYMPTSSDDIRSYLSLLCDNRTSWYSSIAPFIDDSFLKRIVSRLPNETN